MNKYEAFIGKVLDGRYKILGLVGVGGMAFVLKAEDLAMNRIVAIKVLNDQYNGDEQAEKRCRASILSEYTTLRFTPISNISSWNYLTE